MGEQANLLYQFHDLTLKVEAANVELSNIKQRIAVNEAELAQIDHARRTVDTYMAIQAAKETADKTNPNKEETIDA